jgi:hypothetical protein
MAHSTTPQKREHLEKVCKDIEMLFQVCNVLEPASAFTKDLSSHGVKTV